MERAAVWILESGLIGLNETPEIMQYYLVNQVHGINMTDLSEASRLEPVMEALLEETVVTTPCLVLELEMRTCKLEELQISSVFYLKVQRQDYLTALFTHFDMLFTHGRHSVILSTGPRSLPTHWKQMIFCLKEDLVVKEGDTIVGEMKVEMASNEVRRVDFHVKLRHIGTWGSRMQEELFKVG